MHDKGVQSFSKGAAFQPLNWYDEAISAFGGGLEQYPSNDLLVEGFDYVEADKEYKQCYLGE